MNAPENELGESHFNREDNAVSRYNKSKNINCCKGGDINGGCKEIQNKRCSSSGGKVCRSALQILRQ